MIGVKLKFEDLQLYHYTSLDALKSIVENRTLRLTDYRFLNDKTELQFGCDKIQELLDEVENEETKQIVMQTIDKIRNGVSDFWVADTDRGIRMSLRENQAANLYVFSTTNRADDLSMWSMYGKNGCCVKFDAQKLLEYFYGFRDQFLESYLTDLIIRGQVHYGPLTANEKIEYKSLFEHMRENPVMCMQNGYYLCLLRKEDAYTYESEYRICVFFAEEWFSKELAPTQTAAKKVFASKNGCLKPQLELNLLPLDVIESVTISPYNTSDCAVLSVQEFMKANATREVRVKKSEIKVRE